MYVFGDDIAFTLPGDPTAPFRAAAQEGADTASFNVLVESGGGASQVMAATGLAPADQQEAARLAASKMSALEVQTALAKARLKASGPLPAYQKLTAIRPATSITLPPAKAAGGIPPAALAVGAAALAMILLKG